MESGRGVLKASLLKIDKLHCSRVIPSHRDVMGAEWSYTFMRKLFLSSKVQVTPRLEL